MTWLIWLKEVLIIIGAGAVAGKYLWAVIEAMVKLRYVLKERKLNLNGSQKRKQMERVYYERDDNSE